MTHLHICRLEAVFLHWVHAAGFGVIVPAVGVPKTVIIHEIYIPDHLDGLPTLTYVHTCMYMGLQKGNGRHMSAHMTVM